LNKSLKVHYASSKLVIVTSLSAVLLGTIAYHLLPDDGLPIAATLLKSAWVVLGPIGALSVQIAMQLLAIGEDKAIRAEEQRVLAHLVDQRLRYLWDLTAAAVLSMAMCFITGSLSSDSAFLRELVAISLGLAFWTALLSGRLPMLVGEIRKFRWRLARERNERSTREASLSAINASEKDELPVTPEPERRNGTV
jgi:hypothetical protein